MTSKTNNPMFSIVMPMYNAENYLVEAVGSIMAQTIKDWQLIIVDDCSTDGSPLIAQVFEEGDPRISVIKHETNKGASAARNTGFEAATGEYVAFFDADDTCQPMLLQKVLDSILVYPADIVLFGVAEEYRDIKGRLQHVNEVLPSGCVCRTPEEVHAQVLGLERNLLLGYSWNKFYRREAVGSLRYEENTPLIEDAFFNIAFFEKATSANILPTAPYRYVKRQGDNLTNKFVPEYFMLHQRRIRELYEQQLRWGNDTPEMRSFLGALYGRYILSALERNCDPRSEMSDVQRSLWCKRLFEDDELYNLLIPLAHAQDSRTLEACLNILRTRNTRLCCAMGSAIHLARNGANGLFNKIKAGR